MAGKSWALKRSDLSHAGGANAGGTNAGGPNAGERNPVAQLRIPALDRLIHERIRLGMVSALAANSSLTFNELKKLLRTTDGNLSVHARKLEEAGYIACSKSFQGRTPKTEYALTDTGRKAFERYLNHMEALIQAMKR